jgi:hypothetical protein
MNSVIVFLGPTLSREDASRILSATYLPPVVQGDLYRAARERPFAIGIIDGYFDQVPAVWHKEILWALSQRIHVFGASSMGALRASELEPFGMRGTGAVYEAYLSGALEDDDEVAVAHGDADSGYRVKSEAMVNIRATLKRAVVIGILTSETMARLIELAKETFYPDRSYPLLFNLAMRAGINESEIKELRTNLEAIRIDQKRQDALSLLEALRECRATHVPPDPVSFSLSYTEAFSHVVDWAESQPSILPRPAG